MAKPTFFEITVSGKNNTPKPSRERQIYIELADVGPEKLPYKEEMSGQKRLSKCIVVARGDGRTPEQIFEFGGFHPSAAVTGIDKGGAKTLSTHAHRINSSGSGLVSCTSNVEVAKAFCTATPDEHVLVSEKEGYVYFLKVTGSIPPGIVASHEQEYSAPGGVDAQDIVAYRKVKDATLHRFNESSIFVSMDFAKTYPEKLVQLLESFKEHNEILDEIDIYVLKAKVLLENLMQFEQDKGSTSDALKLNKLKLISDFIDSKSDTIGIKTLDSLLQLVSDVCNHRRKHPGIKTPRVKKFQLRVAHKLALPVRESTIFSKGEIEQLSDSENLQSLLKGKFPNIVDEVPRRKKSQEVAGRHQQTRSS